MAKLGEHTSKEFESARERLYVNSWCFTANESMTMWRIYGSLEGGIAIRSSVERHKRALRFGSDIRGCQYGRVKYYRNLSATRAANRDFRTFVPAGTRQTRELIRLGFHKRFCYSEENEWRAVVCLAPPPKPGVPIPCDVEKLIAEVVVSPRAQDFFIEVVSAAMKKFGFTAPVRKSNLLERPRLRK